MTMLKLPRKLESHPQREAVEKLLKQDLRRLWEGGTIEVPVIQWNASLEQTLKKALGLKQLERGQELIDHLLSIEKKGLMALQEKQGSPPAHRVSRVLLMTNDGAERFYRACETTLTHHQDRVLGIFLDIDSAQLGLKLFGPEKGVKALLVSDKEAVTHVLLGVLG